MVTEGQLREGDFIELDGGPSGFVLDVGWRSTRIRNIFNNIVIIPNSKLTESIVTNFSTPTPVILGRVEGRVSLDSDLEEVERIGLEVLREIIEESEESVKTFEPVMRFVEFSDSNVEFRLVFQAVSRVGMFGMRHALIKRLHARFRKEGIVINYPTRRVVLPQSNGRITELQLQDETPALETPSEDGDTAKEQTP